MADSARDWRLDQPHEERDEYTLILREDLTTARRSPGLRPVDRRKRCPKCGRLGVYARMDPGVFLYLHALEHSRLRWREWYITDVVDSCLIKDRTGDAC